MKKGIKELLAEANSQIKTYSVPDAIKKRAEDSGALFVDLRDPREIEREGKIPGAFSRTRGMLEFWIDPESPYHKPVFAEDREFVFYCASGWRSALAAKTAKDMGLEKVAHVGGGFTGWRDGGGETEKVLPKPPKS